ncbi:MAG TPA: thioredoxin family protein [Burkholderiales bacterium]|nr:thioredoxin family protein [Burkholderiales bacterium]
MPARKISFRFILPFIASLFVAAAAWAAVKPFDQAGFEAAQNAGKPILVEIHADWCPTCRAQDPVISELLRDPKNAGFVVLRVDFDNQKAVVKHFHVQYQSTLIVFKGKKEVSRSTGETRKAEIAAQLAKAL